MEHARTHFAIAFTGGIDSIVVGYYLCQKFRELDRQNIQVTLLAGDYGQQSFEKTAELMRLHRDRMNDVFHPDVSVMKQTVPVWMPLYVKTGGLFQYGYVPDHVDPEKIDYSKAEKNYAYCFVDGFEAAIFLQLMIYCSVSNIPTIYTGHQDEPDEWENLDSYAHRCQDASPMAMDRYNLVQELGFRNRVRIENPFITYRMSKYEIGRMAVEEYGIKLGEETYSCQFYPRCGKCGGCVMEDVTIARLKATGFID